MAQGGPKGSNQLVCTFLRTINLNLGTFDSMAKKTSAIMENDPFQGKKIFCEINLVVLLKK